MENAAVKEKRFKVGDYFHLYSVMVNPRSIPHARGENICINLLHLDLCLSARAKIRHPKAKPKTIYGGLLHGTAWAVAFHAVIMVV
jgi:hypothetical protein